MSILHNAALHIMESSGMKFMYLDTPGYSDPIVKAEDAATFEALHILMCADTGADPAYISVRRVANWLTAAKALAAHA